MIGSFGGSDLPPAWWLNLQRDPQASVLISGTTSRVTARAATVEERDRLWPFVTTTHPEYARYQERTARLHPPPRKHVRSWGLLAGYGSSSRASQRPVLSNARRDGPDHQGQDSGEEPKAEEAVFAQSRQNRGERNEK